MNAPHDTTVGVRIVLYVESNPVTSRSGGQGRRGSGAEGESDRQVRLVDFLRHDRNVHRVYLRFPRTTCACI